MKTSSMNTLNAPLHGPLEPKLYRPRRRFRMIRGATALLLFVLSPVGALASATFTAQVDRNGAPITSVIASAPSFNVSFVSASHDTVIVEVKIIGSQVGQGGCAQSTLPRCSWFQVTYNLNPCPVDFVGAEYSLWEYCTGANLRYVRYFELSLIHISEPTRLLSISYA